MASHPTEESVDTELLESARKAMKSNGQVRLINIILQVLHKRYFDRKTAVTFSGILQLLELPDMKESFRALVKKLLINNPKIRYDTREGVFSFKPALNIRSTKDFRNLLQTYESQGKGGVLLSEVEEAMPNSETALVKMKDDLIEISTRDKVEKAYFYANKDLTIELDESFNALWRSVSVEGLTRSTIEAELRKVDVDVLKGAKDNSQERGVKRKRKDHGRRRATRAHVSNTHLEKGYLHDYRGVN